MRIRSPRYRDLSIAKKLTLFAVLMVVLSATVVTALVRSMFANTMLEVAQEQYVEKFDSISQNCLELFEEAQQTTNIVLTDENMQRFFSTRSDASFSERLQRTLRAEKQLDYFDAVQSADRFSSISAYTLSGEMAGTNNIRQAGEPYLALYEKTLRGAERGLWVDLYALDGSLTGIAYVHPYRDYASGQLLGHVMIEYQDSSLRARFARLASGDIGKYIIADRDGFVKMSSDASLARIDDAPYFERILSGAPLGGIYVVDGKKYQVTSSDIDTLGWIMVGLIPVDALTARGNAIAGAIYLVAALGILVMILLNQWIVSGVTRPLANLARTMQRFGDGQLTAEVPVYGNDEIGMLSRVFNEMTAHIATLVEQVRKEQRDKRRFEFSALQAQINPHFLYNTLNSVCSLIKTGQNDAAYRMVHSIGTFYRTALSSGKVLIEIREEMANAQSYIDIQSMRYGKKIRYEIDVGEGLMTRRIVKFTLQPLIENAIYHGVKPLDGPGVIRIAGAVLGGEVRMSVSDNGVGMEPERAAALLDAGAEITKTSFGLNNIDRRLKLYFGQAYGLRIKSAPGAGTTVTVVLPDGEGVQ